MYIFKQQLNKKELELLQTLLLEIKDPFKDFYITKDSKRYYLKNNFILLKRLLRAGEKTVLGDDGILITYGLSEDKIEIYDKTTKSKKLITPRNYVKILAKSESVAEKLLQVLDWNLDYDLWARYTKGNFVIRALRNNGFRFYRPRGKQILLRKKLIK